MALRDSKVFRAIAYTLTGLSLIAFALTVVMRVVHGEGAESYRDGRGLPVPNIAALVTIVTVVAVLFGALCHRLWCAMREHVRRRRDARSSVRSDTAP
jgi:heme A synthase